MLYVFVLWSEVRAHEDISDWRCGESRRLTAKGYGESIAGLFQWR